MLATSHRLQAGSTLAALILAYLSIAAALATPYALQRGPTHPLNNPPSSKPDGSSAISAAISSIQTGHGPTSLGQVSCSSAGPENAYCQTTQNNPTISAALPTTSSWVNLNLTTPSVGPIVYDAADGYVFLHESGTSWEFRAGVWTQLSTQNSPSSRALAAMTYDVADGYVILFGGQIGPGNSPTVLGDTWDYKAGVWTKLSPGVSPSARSGASMAFDVGDNYVLLFGGFDGTGIPTDTWGFRAGTWTLLSTTNSPSGRTAASITYDEVDNYVLLFGGLNNTAPKGDTWEFKSGVWTQLHLLINPAARFFTSLANDAADGYVLLFGGTTNPNPNILVPLGDSWEFKAGVWTQLSPPGSPSPRAFGSMIYDSADGYILLLGGASAVSFLNDNWKFVADIWTEVALVAPPPRYGASMTYDEADSYVLFFGGAQGAEASGALNDTWEFKSGTWTQLFPSSAPSPRALAPMTYDEADGYVVLFGGRNSSANFRGDTWKFKAGVWTQLSPTSSPSARADCSIVYDVADSYVLLYGGLGSTGFLGDTWEFSAGAWTQLSTSSAPSLRIDYSMSYDASDGYILLFGGNGGISILSDTWQFKAGSWTQLSTSTSPPARGGASMAYDAAGGSTVLFGGLNDTTTVTSKAVLNDTWEFKAGTWTEILAPTSPPPSFVDPMAYDAGDGYILLSIGASLSGGSGDTWKFSASGPPPSFDFSLSSPSPGGLTVVQGGTSSSSSITATLTSGSAVPVSFSVTSALPSGVTATFTNSPCSPTCIATVSFSASSAAALGTFMTTITASGGGASHSTSLSLTVTQAVIHDVAVTAVSVYPTQVTGGQTVTISVTLMNTGTVAESNIGVDFSAQSATVDVLPCVPVCEAFVFLDPGGSTTKDIRWNTPTDPSSAGTYTIKGVAVLPAGETDPTPGDNTFTDGTLVVTVPQSFDFILSSPSPNTLSVVEGSTSQPSSITATLVSGATSSLTFSAAGSQNLPLPAGVTASFTNNPCSPTCTTTVSFSATSVAALGTVFVIIDVAGGGAFHSVSLYLTVQASAQAFDYSLSVSPSSTSIAAGSSTMATVTVTLTSGAAQPVLLGASISPNPSVCQSSSGLPSPCGTFAFSSSPVNPSSAGTTSILTISLTNIAPPGIYTLTITGNPSGASSSSATFTLTITAASSSLAASASANPTTGVAPLTIQLTGSATGGTSPYSYSWSFGDGTTSSSQQDPTHQYLQSGTYTAVLTVTDVASHTATSRATITVTAPSTSVECGKDLNCSVRSNSTLSNIKFAGNTIHIEADGPHSAGGYANVTVPKSAIPHIDTVHVLVDNSKLDSSRVTMTSDSTNYYIYFTFTFHSPVLIDIQLTTPENAATPNILGLDPTIFYVIAGVAAAIVVVVIGFTYKARSKSKPEVGRA